MSLASSGVLVRDWVERHADPFSRPPMVLRLFGEKKKLAPGPLRKFEQLRSVLCVIAYHEGACGQLRFHSLEFLGFVFRGMVAVMDKKINRLAHRRDRR